MTDKQTWSKSRLDPTLHGHLMPQAEQTAHHMPDETEDICPPIDASLVAWLRRNHPRPLYEPSLSLSFICHDEGKQAMIQILQTQHDLQQSESRD
jgi:hypothetical protein